MSNQQGSGKPPGPPASTNPGWGSGPGQQPPAGAPSQQPPNPYAPAPGQPSPQQPAPGAPNPYAPHPQQPAPGAPNPYAPHPQQPAPGAPNPYAPAAPHPYPQQPPGAPNPAAPNPYAAGAPNPYAPGAPNPYPQQPAPGAPHPYAPGAPNPYAPAAPNPQQPPPNAFAVQQQPSPFAKHAPPPGAAPYPYPAAPPPGMPAPLPHAHVVGGAPPPGPDEDMFKKSIGRALRLRIEPNEVSPAEHTALLHANPPITDPNLMAFLAWRRSVLFLVAIALIPLSALRFYDAFKDTWPDELRFIALVPAAAEGFLCIVCWYALKHWMHWRKQRRTLFRAWIVFMAAPFLVFLVPMDSFIESALRSRMGDGMEGVDPTAAAGVVVALKATIAIYALLTLAPKAVSLLAGTIRAGIVTKMLFPGSAGPGWIVVLSAPMYTLFVFTLLIVPYQLTGSGWYLGAMIALAGAQLALGRAGFTLAKPMTHDDAVKLVGKARSSYLVAMFVFAGCLIVALFTMAKQIGATTIVTTILAFETNVLLLTLIGSDLVITNLERARGVATGTAHLVDESNKKLSSFVGEA